MINTDSIMKYILLILIGGMLTTTAWAQPGPPGDVSGVAARFSDRVVSVVAYQGGSVSRTGTGFFVNNSGTVATSAHVIHQSGRIEIKTIDGRTAPVVAIIRKNLDTDLAVLDTGLSETAFIDPKTIIRPGAGEKVVVIGSPLGLENTVSDGIISAIRRFDDKGPFYQLTAPVSPGSSGSPVLTMDGRIAGIVTFQAAKGQNLNFAVPAFRLTECLNPPPADKIRVYKDKQGVMVFED
ncbi:MAG: trypsin-like peptidase domain-containing protein [Thermodesulfobacteriota bacterium]|nr:trypsin-like peptidase domain-containing protein [Thermodesulfobacteriota bacterium]